MSAKILTLMADIQQDLSLLKEEIGMLKIAREMERTSAVKSPLEQFHEWQVKGAIGSSLEKVYSGTEHIFKRICKRIDGDCPDGPDSHAELLTRMSIDIPGLRPRFIQEDTYKAFNELGKFRHLERNKYAKELKKERLLDLIGEAEVAVKLLERDIAVFPMFSAESAVAPK